VSENDIVGNAAVSNAACLPEMDLGSANPGRFLSIQPKPTHQEAAYYVNDTRVRGTGREWFLLLPDPTPLASNVGTFDLD
jgi:hypothetical protein